MCKGLKTRVRAVLDWLYPPGVRCLICGSGQTQGQMICPDCTAQLLPYDGPEHAVWLYYDAAKQAVHAFKFRGNTALAEPMGTAMAVYALQHDLQFDVVVPVPLHWRRLWRRGYNQAALLAREVAAYTGVPVVNGSLVRVRFTPPQATLNRQQRLVNLQGAFGVKDNRLAGKRVLLIDDVATTGATLATAKQALLAGGCKQVTCLTACRVP